MPILLYNLTWMIFNCLLAVIPILFGYFFLATNNIFYKLLSGFLWLIFLPNTIYIFTDLIHIFEQWDKVASYDRPLLLLQYILLEAIGLSSFIMAMKPFEKFINGLKLKKNNRVWIVILFNFLIAFGMVLGRVQRVNSWDIFLSYEKVSTSIVQAVTTPQYVGLIVLFGLFCNFFYFLFKDSLYRATVKMMRIFT